MAAVYKLWEGSWADDAAIRNRAFGVFTRPERVRAVHHPRPYRPVSVVVNAVAPFTSVVGVPARQVGAPNRTLPGVTMNQSLEEFDYVI